MKSRLSLLWIFYMFNAAYIDVTALYYSVFINHSPKVHYTQAFLLLVPLDGALLIAVLLFYWRRVHLLGVSSPFFPTRINQLLPCVLVVFVGVTDISQRAIHAYSFRWWELVAAAFLIGVGFWFRRRRVEVAMEDWPDPLSSVRCL
ncbi:MAG TPA: hypothetical protein VMB51_06590 [Solirubrobacteraceae bacterium]|nr:hypothetical protein [Solirubrobacteraceae bacterium]